MFPDLPPDSPQIEESSSHMLPEIPHDMPQIEEPVFHLFPDLPPEIRIKIWNFTVFPRIIKITSDAKCWKLHKEKRRSECSQFHMKQGRDKMVLREVQFNSSTAFLGANQESRHETLPFYNMAFNPVEAQSFLYGTKVARVSTLQDLKFNTTLDTLFVGPLAELKAKPYFIPTSMTSLRHLAVFDPHAGISDTYTSLETLSRIFIYCPNLENLCLCILDPPTSYDQNLREGAKRRRDDVEAVLKQGWFDAENIERWVYPRRMQTSIRSPFSSNREGYLEFDAAGKRWEKVLQVLFLSELRDGYIKPRQAIPASEPQYEAIALRTTLSATFKEL